MSGDAKEFPSNKFVMDPSPRDIRVGGQLGFLKSSLLEEFPSDIGFVLVSKEKSLKGSESEDTKEIAALLVPEDVLGKRVLIH